MTAEIISIGDELLIGQVVNTNASWITEQISLVGIEVNQITTVADNSDHIIKALKSAEKKSDIILITGGLGPTKDDITKQTLCKYFNTNLVFDKEVYQDISDLFKTWGLKVKGPNVDQAEIPENCIPVKNKNGSAVGMWFEEDGKIYVSMPGVPFEMKPMITDYVIPEILKRFNNNQVVHKTVLTQGIGESTLAKKIELFEEQLESNIKLAYLPQPGIVRLRLSASGPERTVVQKLIEEKINQLNELIPEYIFGYDEDTLQEIVGHFLAENSHTVSTAESCTGGYVAHLITSIPGSSEYFRGSIVAYDNQIKEDLLHVDKQSLIKYGAVSEQVVCEMVTRVKEKFSTDYAIATSGIAGPSGGTEEKPVGTTWIAIATPKKVISRHFLMGRHRGRNIHQTAISALNMLRKEMI